MALIKSYEFPGSGFEVENAYHMIRDVVIEKVYDTAQSKFRAKVNLEIFSSKEARDEGKSPIGHTPLAGGDLPTSFDLDLSLSENIVKQAYNHLKSTNYYKDAEEV